MSGVLLQPYTSTLGGVPLTVLGQEDNIMAFICKSWGETSELSGKIIVRKKDLIWILNQDEPEVIPRKLFDIAGQARQAIYALPHPHALCQVRIKSLRSKRNSLRQAFQKPPPVELFSA